jgi:hypothetical protein
MEKVVICIPTKRPPPILTIDQYGIANYEVLVLSDPSVYVDHKHYYKSKNRIHVLKGKVGMGPQSYECYRQAALHGYNLFFRMDDDLPRKTFIMKEGYPALGPVIQEAVNCLKELNVTLVGFANTSNTAWLGEGFKRTYGMIHGGANLSISSKNPRNFMDPNIIRAYDIYQTAAHRWFDYQRGNSGECGRVAHIGFDKKMSTGKNTSYQVTDEQRLTDRILIKSRFKDCFSLYEGGPVRMKRLPRRTDAAAR